MSLWNNIKTTYKYNGIKGVVRKIKYKVSSGYKKYLKAEKIPSQDEMLVMLDSFTYKPKISVIMPVYKPNLKEFEAALLSIINQGYKNVELCLVDDGSNSEELDLFLKNFSKLHKERVRYKKNLANQGIADASNDAIALATGTYIALVDQDDMVAAHAFFEYVKKLQTESYDFLYSDEDMIDEKGRRFNPQFKPDWSPHTLLSRMYVNHLSMYKKTIIDKIGGFRSAYNGTQDYDMLLRASIYFKSVCHVDEILYHWRTSENSIAKDIENKMYIYERAEQAVTAFLASQAIEADVKAHQKLLIYDIDIKITNTPLISIIMPFKNSFDVTKKAIDSIIQYGGYAAVELILIDNNSEILQQEMYKNYVESIQTKIETKIVEAKYTFNYSKMNNEAVNRAKGEYLLFLNNDIEFFEANSIKKLFAATQLPKVGAVGCTLLYPNGSIQHAGVILGYHEIAGHSGVGLAADDPGYYGRNVSFYNFSAVTAACLMVRKSYFQQYGGFDEQLTVAYNDVDFCLRLLTQGLYNVNVGSVQVLHHESLTRGADSLKDSRYIEECKIMSERWKDILNRDPFYNKNLSINVGELYQIK